VHQAVPRISTTGAGGLKDGSINRKSTRIDTIRIEDRQHGRGQAIRYPIQYFGSYSAWPFLKLPLAYSVSGWLLITLLALDSAPVHAEWVAVESAYQSPGLQTVYIDPAAIRRHGNLVTIVTLTDWKWMQGNRSPTRFYSTRLKKEFDCAGKRLRRLAFTDFYGHMGTGAPVAAYESEGSWYSVESESLNQALWEVACGNG